MKTNDKKNLCTYSQPETVVIKLESEGIMAGFESGNEETI